MNDKEKIKAAITMLKQLKKMVGFFMKKEISELIERLEKPDIDEQRTRNKEQRLETYLSIKERL